MSTPITFITTHSISNGQLNDFSEQDRQFAEFVQTNEPRLLDFQAYINEEKTAVRFLFVFPDEASEPEPAPAQPGPMGRPFRDTGWAALLAAATIVVLLFMAVYAGSVAPLPPG